MIHPSPRRKVAILVLVILLSTALTLCSDRKVSVSDSLTILGRRKTGPLKTHINSREKPRITLRFHPQQVLQLGDDDVHGCCCGEASHQGLGEVDCYKAKPEKT